MLTRMSLTECLKSARATVANTYDLDEESLQNIYEIFVAACKDLIDAKPGKAAKEPKEKSKKRAKTAYNMYVKHQFEISKDAPVKSEGENSQSRMSTFSGQWKELSDKEKEPYIKMAADANSASSSDENEDDEKTEAASKPKGKGKAKDAKPAKPAKAKDAEKRRMTGYNLFYSEKKDEIKASLKDGEKIMAAVGAVWKSISDEEKGSYNKRAAEL